MRKIFNLAAVAVLAIGMASCTKDATENIGGDPQTSANKFTFVLPAQSNVITYAAHDHAVEAVGDESKFDLTKTSIYIFNASGNLEAIVNSDIKSGSHTDGRPTATIEVDDEWDWTGTKTFFMVANTDKEGGSSLPTAVPVAPADPITVADFKNQMTGTMVTTTVGGVEVVSSPYSSTGGMILADYKEVTNIETAPSTELELHRPVARIDVHNDVTFGKVTITHINVSDANLNGYIFAADRGVAASGLAKGDIRNIPVSTTLVAGDASENIWGTNAPEDATHEYQKQAAAAYIYPTNLKAGNAAGTELTLIGEVNGIPATYTLNKEDSGSIEDLEIKANTRYIISAIDELTHTFILSIADWDAGESLIGRPDVSSFGLLADPSGDAVNSFVGNTVALKAAAGNTVTFTVKTSSAKGTTWAWDAVPAGVSVAVDNKSTVSYATPYFASEYTITVDSDLSLGESFFQTLTITDKAKQSNAISISFMFDKDNADAVMEINETTFPDATFRAHIASKFGLSGAVTQAQLDGATEFIFNTGANMIPGADRAKITTFKGIEYFTNLTTLNIEGCSNVIELDLTALTKLHTLGIKTTGITTLDLSKNADFTTLYAGGSKLVGLDLSNNHKMAYITAFDIPSLTTVTLSPQSANTLTYFGVYNTGLTTNMDFTGFSKLETLYCYNNPNITSLNISGCTELKDFACHLNTGLTSVVGLSECKKLTTVALRETGLTGSVDLSGCTSLETLTCYKTDASSLNVSGCTSLTSLYAQLNPNLTTLNVTNCPALTYLTTTYSPIQSVDVSGSPLLTYLSVSGTAMTSLDISANTKLETFHYSNTTLAPSVSHLSELKMLSVGYLVENLDLSGNAKLESLRFGVFDFEDKDINGFDVVIEDADCNIKSLDLSNNPLLTTVWLINCPDLNPSIPVWNGFNVGDPASVFNVSYRVEGRTPAVTYVAN